MSKLTKSYTLCYPLEQDRILLGLKQSGWQKGEYNGFGGKMRRNEPPALAAARELYEESKLIVDPESLDFKAILRFEFEKSITELYVYFVYQWENVPKNTKEMVPIWFPLASIPYNSMYEHDVRWLPYILDGEFIEGRFLCTDDAVVQQYTITHNLNK